ncbi:MAG: hypothetical protein QOC71_1658 [Thermoplasmata archaeon]|nr:hypothetical protein [Thermoplasmata archaeon]
MRWSLALGLLLMAPLLAGCVQFEDTPSSGSQSTGPSHSATGSQTGHRSTTATGTPRPGSGGGGGGGGGSGGLGGNGTDGASGNATGPPREWAALGVATIRPGASINGGECTANFVFTSLDNSTVYLGTAAHCFSNDGNTATDGCVADVQALGAKRDISGASHAAVLVYSSWAAMQAAGASGDVCNNNDFALMQLDPEDAAKVNPAMQSFGGPTGIATASDINTFSHILSYGNSGSRPEDSALSPREGYVTLPAGGCDSRVVFPNAAIPGDSGSPVIMANGLAMGDFVSIELAPLAGQGHVCLLEDLLAYAASVGMPVRLATAELIDGGILPV